MNHFENISENELRLKKFLVGEIITTYNRRRKKTGIQVSTSSDCYQLIRRLFKDSDMEHRERMYAVFLSQRHEVLGWQLQGIGGLSGTYCDLKVVFQTALLCNSASIILAHNHPSGNLKPSGADIDLTKKASGFGKFIGMTVLDHLIITIEGYSSFADEGLI